MYDHANERFEADGPVVLTRGNEVMRGSRLEVDVAAETASIFDADGNVGTDYFFTGAAVHMLSEDRFTILDAQFTACEAGDDGRAPDWSFRAKRVDVNANGYAKTRGVSFRARKVPLVYLPYMLWPVQSSRVSGFLTPKPGFSTRRGPSLGLAYYWAINRSYDATFNVDLYAGAPSGSTQAFSTEPFWGLGTEFRYRPTEGTGGEFDGYLIDDTERGERRWRMRWNHQSRDLPGGFRGVVRFEDVSDFDFFRDFERRVDRNTLRQLYSTAFVSRNWVTSPSTSSSTSARRSSRPTVRFSFASSPRSSTSSARRAWAARPCTCNCGVPCTISTSAARRAARASMRAPTCCPRSASRCRSRAGFRFPSPPAAS